MAQKVENNNIIRSDGATLLTSVVPSRFGTEVAHLIPDNDNAGTEPALFELTQENLKQCYRYDPDTGIFTRLISGGGQKAGSFAGVINDRGYLRIWIAGKSYKAHRLAFLYVTGKMPRQHSTVDHINRCRADNRWSNLRLASHGENLANSGPQQRNTTGFKGVSRSGNGKRFVAQITVRGEVRYLGTFDAAAEAGAAYEAAANDAYGEFAFRAALT